MTLSAVGGPLMGQAYHARVRRSMQLAALIAFTASLAACGTVHSSGSAPEIGKLKAVQERKIKAIEETRRRAAAVGPRNVVARRSGCADGRFPTWSPDGKQIAWAGGRAICIASANGSHVHALPQTRGLVDSPFALDWVRPGLLIYGDDYTVSRVPVGSKPQLLRGVGAPAIAVADGGNRFSTSTKSDCPTCVGPAHVWTLSGSLVGSVGSNQVYNDPPSLSPDGKLVTFVQGGAVWTAQADGSQAHELVPHGAAPLWSPTGGTIAYITTDASHPEGNLWVVATNGGTSKLVGHNLVDNGGWSPNGKLIASSTIGGLVVADVATGQARKLPFIGYPSAWSPDSKNLLVTARLSSRCFSLWSEPVDGSKPNLISSCY